MMEEVDYMSDDFIKGCEQTDIVPGLPKSHSQQRTLDQIKKKNQHDEKNKKVNKPKSILQTERLEEGLQEPLDSSNKGFAMLAKMGFKAGMGLGKSSSGIVEPVGIQLKNDRMGLGRAEALKQIQIRKRNIRKQHLETTSVEDFRIMQSKKSRERDTIHDLRRSQRVCHQMDTEMKIEFPAEKWFWPEGLLPTKDEESEVSEEETDDEYDCFEKLEILTGYLRETFMYCIWCGVKYQDEKDFQECPGPTRDDH